MLHAECIRHDYTSLAENAYPEAYSKFKHSMLLLVFEEELQTSPVKADWSLQTRTELAGMLCRTLRQIAGKSPLLLPFLSCQCQCHWGFSAQHACWVAMRVAADVVPLDSQRRQADKDCCIAAIAK